MAGLQTSTLRKNIDGIIGSHNRVSTPAVKRIEEIKQAAELASSKLTPQVHRPLQHSKTLMRNAVKKQINLEKSKPKAKHDIAPHLKRSVQPSITLMRKAVKPPIALAQITPKNKLQIAHRKKIESTLSNSGVLKPAANIISRAKTIPQHELVSRFGDVKNHVIARASQLAEESRQDTNVHQKNIENLDKIEKQLNEGDIDAFTFAALEKAENTAPHPQQKTKLHHKVAKKLHLKPSIFIRLLVIVLMLIFAGGLGFYYFNNLELAIANHNAGISTSLPSFVPAGFSLNKITNSPGSVTLYYKSNTDNRSYSIAEQASTWDSKSLLEGVVQPTVGTNYSTIDAYGRTVYSFNNVDVWVSGGIYYQLTDNAQFTSSQLVQIINGA